MTRWAVLYRRARQLDVWAVIVDVPDTAKHDDVSDALAGWRGWRAWQGRIVPGGEIRVVPETKWTAPTKTRIGDPVDLETGSAVHTLRWADLTPQPRRINIVVPPELHRALTQEAADRGTSLHALVLGELAAALEREPSP